MKYQVFWKFLFWWRGGQIDDLGGDIVSVGIGRIICVRRGGQVDDLGGDIICVRSSNFHFLNSHERMR